MSGNNLLCTVLQGMGKSDILAPQFIRIETPTPVSVDLCQRDCSIKPQSKPFEKPVLAQSLPEPHLVPGPDP